MAGTGKCFSQWMEVLREEYEIVVTEGFLKYLETDPRRP